MQAAERYVGGDEESEPLNECGDRLHTAAGQGQPHAIRCRAR
jgi:hypothetical protein